MKTASAFTLASVLVFVVSSAQGALFPAGSPGTPAPGVTVPAGTVIDVFETPATTAPGEPPIEVFTAPLPFRVIPGDVVMLEPGTPTNQLTNPERWSDVVRFAADPAGQTSLYLMFSDLERGFPTGFPLMDNHVFVIEGPNGKGTDLDTTEYTIGTTAAVLVAYRLHSDVPEPSTIVLAAMGLVGMGAYGVAAGRRARTM